MKLFLSIFACSLLSGCGSAQNAEVARDGGTDSSGVPNPASVFCSDKNGQSQYFNTPAGTSSLCKIGNGAIGAWTLFRDASNSSDEQSLATTAFLTHVEPEDNGSGDGSIGLPNPSATYCTQVQGSYKSYPATNRNQNFSICEFADRSFIEAWTLFSGPGTNSELAVVLRGQSSTTFRGAEAEKLMASLQSAGVQNSGAVGAGVFEVSEVNCQMPVVPSPQASCLLNVERNRISVTGENANSIFEVLSLHGGREDGNGRVGASAVRALNLSCSYPVVPNRIVTCVFSK